jgi:GNAT superfamily N-acetyltransferase
VEDLEMGISTEAVIRPAKVSDSGAIFFILKECGCFSHTDNEALRTNEAYIIKNLERSNADENHTILVAENQNGEVVGYTAVHWLQYLMASDVRGYISELFVLPSARGRGIGRRLLEVVKEQALARRCSRLMVVNVKNRITYPRRFFLKLAWKERPEVTNFILPLE